jgi:hypothetical protein
MFFIASRITCFMASATLRANAVCRIVAAALAWTITAICVINHALGDPRR